MTTLADKLLPDALWQRIQPLLRLRPPERAVACLAPWRIGPAWPRSSSWPAHPPRGGCCRPRSWAVGRRPPAGGGWMSGPAPGCSISFRRCCWMSWVRRAASTWPAQASTRSACARSKGDLTGANPVDRGKAGSKLHLASDAGGLPLSVVISAANANDATMFEAVLDDIPPILMPTGRRRHRPGKVHADKAYDHRRCRAYLRRRGIRPRIARRMIESSARLDVTAGRSSAPGPGWAASGAAHPL